MASEALLRRWWAASGGLGGRPTRDPLEAVLRCAGPQAQDAGAGRMQVRARTRGLIAADVDRALHEERSLVRTWAMRGTLHLLPAEGLRGLLALVGPVLERRYARRRAELGLTPAVLERAIAALPRVLAGRGPVARAEMVDGLLQAGIPIDPRDQAPAHLLVVAALRGTLARGPDAAGGAPTAVLLDEWLPPQAPPEPDAALAGLALAHLRAFGPADDRDLARWSGLPAAVARRGVRLLEGGIREVATPLGPRWVVRGSRAPDADAPVPARLLGAFDTHLLGHADRSPLLPAAHERRVSSGGWILPTALVDGAVVATWRAERAARRVTVRLRPFAPLGDAALEALAAEARDVGRFLGLEGILQAEEATPAVAR